MPDAFPTPPPDRHDHDIQVGRQRAVPDSFPMPPVGASIAYRPISGFAIAGFACACLFAVLMLVVAVVALVQVAPFFYPLLVLLLPAAGLALCVVARSQIRASEGTRGGESLARAGIWISLLSGLGYFVYYQVTELAVTQQANAFLMEPGEDSGFFPHIQKSATSKTDFYAAFLLSLPVGSRGQVRPEDEAAVLKQHDLSLADGSPGLLTQFRQNLFTRIFLTAPPGETIAVESLAVQNWGYEGHSYFVKRFYRVTTPEAVMDFTVLARSSEGEAAGEQRKWFVDVKNLSRPVVKLTALGEGIARLRNHSHDAIKQWTAALNAGASFPLTEEADATSWAQLMLSNTQRSYVRARFKELLESKDPNRIISMNWLPADEVADWELADGKVRLGHNFRMNLEPRGDQPAYQIEGRAALETKSRVDPRALTAEPEWIVRSILISRAAPVNMKKGPGDSKAPPH